MNLNKFIFSLIGLACGTAVTHGQFTTIFSDAGDESALVGATTPQVDPIPDPLTGVGWGVMGNSGLTGDAIRMWNVDGLGRAEIEYTAPSPLTSYVEFNLNGLIESGLDGQYFWRVGASGANLATLGGSSMEFRFRNNGGTGQVYLRTTTGQTFETVTVGVDTAFTVSVLANAAASGGSSVAYDKNGVSGTLDPQQFVLIVNDSLIGTGAYDFLNPASDISASWIATGTAEDQVVPTLQIDNYTVVPEPSVYAMTVGFLVLGLAMVRRRRR